MSDDLGYCRCGKPLKRNANRPDLVGHYGTCPYGRPYADGVIVAGDPRPP